MVTIKIQSIDDIIRAYLADLGFDEVQGKKNLAEVKKLLPKDCCSGDEVIRCLDERLKANGQIIFYGSQLADPQMLALARLTYIRAGGAGKWGADILTKDQFNAEMISCLHKEIAESSPNYVLSQMKPQPIEPAHLLQKIFRHSGKKAKA